MIEIYFEDYLIINEKLNFHYLMLTYFKLINFRLPIYNLKIKIDGQITE